MATEQTGRGKVAGVGDVQTTWARRSIKLRVLVAQFVNDLGSGVTAIAVPLLVYAHTHSVVDLSLVSIAGAVPTLAFSLIGGSHADRVDRQRLVVGATAAVGVLLCLLPVAFRLAGLPVIIAITFATRTLLAFSNPAFRATLPDLFGDDFQDYTGKRTGLSFLAQAIGPALGGAMVGVFGAANAVYVDGASYLVFALIVLTIASFDPDHRSRQAEARAVNALNAVGAGLRHLRENSGARAILLYWFFSLLALPISLLAAVPYIRTDLHRSAFDYGLVIACYAIASLVGSYVAGKVKFRGGARRWLLVSGLGYGLANLLMLLHPDFPAFCALWVLWGLSYGPEEVVSEVAFVQLVPDKFRSRMYSARSVVFATAAIVGAALAGPIADGIGAEEAMVAAGAIFIAATLVSFVAGPGARALRAVDLTDRH